MVVVRIATACLLLAALFVPAAQAEPPADAFCVITIQAFDDFRVIRYTVDQETTIEERSALWPSVDRDGDGAVTPEENDAFRRANLQIGQGTLGSGNKTIWLMPLTPQSQQTQPPLYWAMWREVGHTFHKRNYTLPPVVKDVRDLETQEVREFRFDVRGQPIQVMISGGDPNLPPPGKAPTPPPPPPPPAPPPGNTTSNPPPSTTPPVTATPTPSPVIEYVVVRAPPGWVVRTVAGYTYEGGLVRSFDEAVVDLPAFDTKRPYTITFVPAQGVDSTASTEEPVPSPLPASASKAAPAVAGPVAILLAGMALLRRRQVP